MQIGKEDLRTYEQRAFFEKKDAISLSPFSIFLAVLGAIIMSWVIRQAYLEWQIHQAVAVFNQQMQTISAQSNAQFQSIQLQNVARRTAEEEKIRFNAEVLEKQRLDTIQADNENRARVAAAIDEQARKERAWKSFYKPIVGCGAENPNRETVKCGNDYIKAHKHFEASWTSNTN